VAVPVHGWATPIATDIAFALGVMSLLGERISCETKVFFQTLAIADDILAIVVIALFYGRAPSIPWCAATLVVVLLLWGINRMRVYSCKPYLVVGLVLWVCMYNSGIHATLAGVILAFFLPSRSDVRLSALKGWLNGRAHRLDDTYDDERHVLGQHDFTTEARTSGARHAPRHAGRSSAWSVPSRCLSTSWCCPCSPSSTRRSGSLALTSEPFSSIRSRSACSLVPWWASRSASILTTLVLVRVGFSKLPRHVDWTQVIAVGLMGGLGFTMSIPHLGLAFADPAEVMAAKCAILAGSLTAAGRRHRLLCGGPTACATSGALASTIPLTS